jgi:hypothetical protein
LHAWPLGNRLHYIVEPGHESIGVGGD